jgi:hypothetical protein
MWEILSDFPTLTDADVRDVMAFAVASAAEPACRCCTSAAGRVSVKLDENLAPSVLTILQSMGYNLDTATSEGR